MDIETLLPYFGRSQLKKNNNGGMNMAYMKLSQNPQKEIVVVPVIGAEKLLELSNFWDDFYF